MKQLLNNLLIKIHYLLDMYIANKIFYRSFIDIVAFLPLAAASSLDILISL